VSVEESDRGSPLCAFPGVLRAGQSSDLRIAYSGLAGGLEPEAPSWGEALDAAPLQCLTAQGKDRSQRRGHREPIERTSMSSMRRRVLVCVRCGHTYLFYIVPSCITIRFF
jgi:hypothetical protein